MARSSRKSRVGRGSGGRTRRIGVAVLTAVLIALIGGAVAAWAYDDAKGDEIAEGVTIGGVDVGGLTAKEARAVLKVKLMEPMRKPITVKRGEQSWRLPAKELKLRGDLGSAVEQAVEVSRRPSLPSRVWRYVTGGTVDLSITPRFRYSKPAVNDFIREIAGEINRDPVDAGVYATGTSVEVVEAENGVSLRDRLLSKQLHRAVGNGSSKRVFAAKTIDVEPEITTEQAAEKYPVYLTVDRSSFQLRLWKNLKLVKTYTIAVGKAGQDTPTGEYSIQNKAENPTWHVPNSDWAGDLAGQVIPPGPDNPLKARWMGIYNGAGIHGTEATSSLGSAASMGCIRMAVPDVIELYDQVPVGTPIYIA